MYGSMIEVVADYAKREPGRLCVADKAGAHTYGEMWQKAQAGAEKLAEMGIQKRDCVMVECTQDADFLICDLACELRGAIFVPVEHRATADRVEKILEDTDTVLFLCETEYEVPVKKMKAESLLHIGADAAPSGDVSAKNHTFPRPEDTAEILYTTGTTGTSKGIEVTHGNNIALAENVKYGTEMKEGNVEFIPLPLSHSHGLRCCYANMLNGSAVVLTEGVTQLKLVFDLIEKYQVTAMDVSPSAVMIMEQLAKGQLSKISGQIDYIQVGTEPLQENVKEMLVSSFPSARLYNFYGSTESGRTCVLDFNKENRAKCIGKPTRNARFIVTDEKRRPIESSRDNMGLLASAGPMNMKGYWRQPELTARTMQDGYVYTNDMGYIDEDGYVYMFGRMDNVINCQGIKIAPEEIEEVAGKYGQVLDCACVPMEDKLSGQVPKLYVVVQDKELFQIKDLLSFLRQSIDGNKMPKKVEVIEEIPRTSNGKIHRARLVTGKP